MTDASDLALAQLSLAAYDEAPALPAGFTALNTAIPLAPGESFADGVFHSGNAAALLTSGVVDGVNSLVLTFRGSDDQVDSLNDLRGINADYAQFDSLFAAVDAAVASGAYQQVVVSGHSLGGSLAQQYMAEHPDQPGGVAHIATTFGSPGAQLADANDARIENIVIADDPAVFLGTHRAEAGAVLRADPQLADAVAQRAAEVFPGLTAQDARDSLPFLTVNYVNRGGMEVLPAANGGTGFADAVQGLASADPARHSPELYVQATAAAMNGSGNDVPDSGGDAQDFLLRGLLQNDLPNNSEADTLLRDLLGNGANDINHAWEHAVDQVQAALHDIGGWHL